MIDQQAQKIWSLALEEVLMAYHFLVNATGHFSFQETDAPISRPMTDASTIWYNAQALRKDFIADQTRPVHAVLHMLLHCMFAHPFKKQVTELALWDLSCDIAVEKIIAELSEDERIREILPPPDLKKAEALFRIESRAVHMTAEEIYNTCMDDPQIWQEILRYSPIFTVDDHGLWQSREKTARRHARKELARGSSGEENNDQEAEETSGLSVAEEELSDQIEQRETAKVQNKWRHLAEQTQMELSAFKNRFGSRAGRFLDQLYPILWEEIDYGEFLRNFGAVQEILKVSDEAFDVAYYKYGLEIYGNIPLIEPLEFADEHRISTFVIAIDTSGSVEGEIVQSFLQKTVDVLRSAGSFTRMVDIFLIQCDAEIQNVERLTDMDSLEDLIPKLILRGFGGTDFRPVFSYVDQMIQDGKLKMPDGLLYFTDGVGTYPEKTPEYKTAFIFNRDDHISPNVPPWAIRAVLSTDAIRLLPAQS